MPPRPRPAPVPYSRTQPPGILPSGLRTATQCWKCKIPVFHDEAISWQKFIRDGMVRNFTYCKPCYHKFVETENRRREAVMATRKKKQ